MTNHVYEPKLLGRIDAEEVIVGQGVVIEESVLISGPHGPARRVVLGDFCYIGRHTRILTPEFSLGDYSKLNAFSFAHGTQPMHIGRNCWIGGAVVLDSNGGLDLDDNVGIGAHSQVWTHIQFGDLVEGCRFYSRKYMHVGKDAWLVGHCILSPVRVGERSMALVGSVVTHDMEAGRVYAGVPAVDVTDRTGPQFAVRTVDEKAATLRELIERFEAAHPEFRGELRVARSPAERQPGACWFDVSTRTYTQTYRPAEVAFLKSHTPLVKFTPDGKPSFVRPRPDGGGHGE
jgi:acetyltransferase-like isoleucine patch superfamily enzyme